MTLPNQSIDLIAINIEKIRTTMQTGCGCDEHGVELPVHVTTNLEVSKRYYTPEGKTSIWEESSYKYYSPHHGHFTSVYNTKSTWFIPLYEHYFHDHYHSRSWGGMSDEYEWWSTLDVWKASGEVRKLRSA
ncbi:hypothetical protein P153DRAFT_399811, partial [Dothidotthia symphoricarpi CBS 119687]